MRRRIEPRVRVLCGNCRKKLTDLDVQPMPGHLTQMFDRGRRIDDPRRARHDGCRYPCPRCGTDHLVKFKRLERAYLRILRSRTERKVIVIPQDL